MQTPEEKRAYNRGRYQRESAKILAQQKERYQNHREEILSKDRLYRQKNSEKINARSKAYYLANTAERRKYIADRYRDAKIKAVKLLGGACQHCGWDKHPAALQFHHRDPSQKIFNVTTRQITSPKKVPWEMVVDEIQKCDLLCANCHFIEESAWEVGEEWNR